MAKLWLTRPKQYAEETAGALSQFETVIHPLLEYHDLPLKDGNWPPPFTSRLQRGDRLAFTSAYAVQKFCEATNDRDFIAYCVGDKTTKAARGSGIRKFVSAGGDVEALQKLIMREEKTTQKIWHLAAKETAGDLQGALHSHGFYNVEKVALYETKATEALPQEFCQELKQGMIKGVLLYSPKTAQIFMDLMKKHELADLNLTAFCLSQNVAEKISGVGDVLTAEKPTEDSLLHLIIQQFGTG